LAGSPQSLGGKSPRRPTRPKKEQCQTELKTKIFIKKPAAQPDKMALGHTANEEAPPTRDFGVAGHEF